MRMQIRRSDYSRSLPARQIKSPTAKLRAGNTSLLRRLTSRGSCPPPSPLTTPYDHPSCVIIELTFVSLCSCQLDASGLEYRKERKKGRIAPSCSWEFMFRRKFFPDIIVRFHQNDPKWNILHFFFVFLLFLSRLESQRETLKRAFNLLE